MTEHRASARRRPRRRSSRLRRSGLLALALAVVFALGVALGQVTASDPEPEGTSVTTVRTILPVTAPTGAETEPTASTTP